MYCCVKTLKNICYFLFYFSILFKMTSQVFAGSFQFNTESLQDVSRSWEYCFVEKIPHLDSLPVVCSWQAKLRTYHYLEKKLPNLIMRLRIPEINTSNQALIARIKASYRIYFRGKEIFSLGDLEHPEKNKFRSKRMVIPVSEAKTGEFLYVIVTSSTNEIGTFARSFFGPLQDSIFREIFHNLLDFSQISILLFFLLILSIFLLLNPKHNFRLVFPILFSLFSLMHVADGMGDTFKNLLGSSEIFWQLSFQWHYFIYLLPLLMYFPREKIQIFGKEYPLLSLYLGLLGVSAIFFLFTMLVVGTEFDSLFWYRVVLLIAYPLFLLDCIFGKTRNLVKCCLFAIVSTYTLSALSMVFSLFDFSILKYTNLFNYILFVLALSLKYREEKNNLINLEKAKNDVLQRYHELYDSSQMMVHDVRRPLTMVDAIIKLVGQGKDERKTQELIRKFLPVLESASMEAYSITEDISVIGTESHESDKEMASLADVAESCLQDFQRLGLREGVTLELKIQNIPDFCFDSQKIKRVLKNLLANALKAQKHPGKIWVEAGLSESGNMIQVTVGNENSFIAEEERENIFRPFVSGQRSTGLGLAVCRKIIGLHGGNIWCSSDESRITRFIFTLPVTNS